MTKRNDLGVLALLTAAMGIGPLLIYGLSATSTLVIDSLNITVSQFGFLAALTFIAASASSFVFGRFADHFSPRAQMLGIFSAAAASYVLAAVSQNYWWLLVAMAVSGVAQALSNPVTNRIISKNVASSRQGTWIGVKQSGVQVSQLVAGLGFPILALATGWRSTLWVGAIVATLLTAVAWRRYGGGADATAARLPTSEPELEPDGRRRSEKAPVPRTVWLFTAYALLSGAGLQATNVYLPLFAHDALGLPLTVAGLTAAAAGAVGVTSRIFWGRTLSTDTNPFTLLLIVATGSTFGALALLGAQLWVWPTLLWVGVILHGASALASNVLVMAGAVRTVAPSLVGRASSVIAVGMYFGFAAGPLAAGALVERTGSFISGWQATAGVYVLCGVVSVAGIRISRPRSRTATPIERDRLSL
ncbi:MFS transporter [Rhodococcus marinonascens]|uniref:MFS transporter n=1 Tax=Rhodococcus marinonascens TaxID=38311 RepID=UPI000933FE08|nr:MFS transporter [Rhodococcus marinonascens]